MKFESQAFQFYQFIVLRKSLPASPQRGVSLLVAPSGVGYSQMIATWSVGSYYGSVMALTLFYLVMSFNKVLPWSVCDDAWADENCVDASSTNVTYTNNSQSSSEQYY